MWTGFWECGQCPRSVDAPGASEAWSELPRVSGLSGQWGRFRWLSLLASPTRSLPGPWAAEPLRGQALQGPLWGGTVRLARGASVVVVARAGQVAQGQTAPDPPPPVFPSALNLFPNQQGLNWAGLQKGFASLLCDPTEMPSTRVQDPPPRLVFPGLSWVPAQPQSPPSHSVPSQPLHALWSPC